MSPKPMNPKTKNDIYTRMFEILDLRKELVSMKKDYATKKKRLELLEKKEADYQQRLRDNANGKRRK